MEIQEGHNKFYVNDADGNQVAEIVFVPTGEHLSIIEHTDVDPSLKGQGVGKQLVAKVVEKMRAENRKIIPLCPDFKALGVLPGVDLVVEKGKLDVDGGIQIVVKVAQAFKDGRLGVRLGKLIADV